MLLDIRERAQGWVAGLIVLALVLVLALFGLGSYVGPTGRVVVAEVNGVELELDDFRRTFRIFESEIRAANQDPRDYTAEYLKSQTLTRMVNDEVLRQFADSAGIRISNEQLATGIVDIPQFQADGEFSQALYVQSLRQAGYPPKEFEEKMRSDLVSTQIRTGVLQSGFVPLEAVLRTEAIRGQTRDLRYFEIPYEKFLDEEGIGDEDIRAYYDENAAEFTRPERVVIEYIDFSVDAIADQVEVAESDLRSYYDANADLYRSPEERSADHVLVRVAKDAASTEVTDALEFAGKLRARVVSGEDIGDIIESAIGKDGPVVEGGELDFFPRDTMPAEFDAAVFAMQPGDISEPIRTDFGFHVIRLNEIKPESAKEFAEVEDQLRADLRKDLAERQYYDRLEEVNRLAFEVSDSLGAAADAAGVEVQTTAAFSRDGEVFGDDGSKEDAVSALEAALGELEGLSVSFGDSTTRQVIALNGVVETAFSEAVLQDRENSKGLDVDDERLIFLRVAEQLPSERIPLEEVRDALRENLVERAAREVAIGVGDELLGRILNGEEPDSVAADAGYEWRSGEEVGRNDPELNRSVVREAFRLGHPEDGAPRYGAVPTSNDSYAIVEVSRVVDAVDLDLNRSASAGQREMFRVSRLEFYEFVESLKAAAEVTTFPDRL